MYHPQVNRKRMCVCALTTQNKLAHAAAYHTAVMSCMILPELPAVAHTSAIAEVLSSLLS